MLVNHGDDTNCGGYPVVMWTLVSARSQRETLACAQSLMK